jgi:hypothetical protein
MTNDEIRELIEAFEKIAASKVYSDSIIRKARWKVEELKAQLPPEEPKVPEKTGINKWFNI